MFHRDGVGEEVKLHLLSPDAASRIDATNRLQLLDNLPQSPMGEADVVVLPVSFFESYVFNPDVARIKKPIVVIDYLEISWNYFDNNKTFILGRNELPEKLQTPEWQMLDAVLGAQPPILTFKRELMESARAPNIRPIEYLCTQPSPPLQTKEQFDARPFEVFSSWGYSHPMRPAIHGEIFGAMGTRGINVVSDFCQIPNMPQMNRTWLSFYSPFWCRKPMAEVMALQQQAKISLSLYGAGRKSFRDGESPIGSIMARPFEVPQLAWSFPWTDQNSLHFREHAAIEDLDAFTRRGDLYDIYLAGQENVGNYRADRYRDYVMNSIKECL